MLTDKKWFREVLEYKILMAKLKEENEVDKPFSLFLQIAASSNRLTDLMAVVILW